MQIHMATPVGFEPTRGDPIGLAGRRLSRSAKVSSDVRSLCAFSVILLNRSVPCASASKATMISHLVRLDGGRRANSCVEAI